MVFPDNANVGQGYQPSVNRLTPSPISISTNRVGDNGQLDASFWVYVVDPGEDADGTTVLTAQITGTTGNFVGTPPAGWSNVRTGQGLYTLTVDWNTDARYVDNPANWCFFIPITQTSGCLVNGTPNIGLASVTYLMEAVRLVDGNRFDQNFFVVALKSGERNELNRLQVASVSAGGAYVVPTPAGWTIIKGAAGVYTIQPNYGESIDPRNGLWGAWTAPNRQQVSQAFSALLYSGNDIGVTTRRPIDFGIENKSFWPVVFKVGEELAPEPPAAVHTLDAVVSGPALGFANVIGLVFGSFTPANSSGLAVGRLTYGGSLNAVSFSFRGNQVNSDATWRQLRVTGQFQNGQQTKTLLRTDSSFAGYNATTDETSWGLPEFTDAFVSGRSYTVEILDRTPG
jgi:hypothetical protein